jgi:hypothetical protein
LISAAGVSSGRCSLILFLLLSIDTSASVLNGEGSSFTSCFMVVQHFSLVWFVIIG